MHDALRNAAQRQMALDGGPHARLSALVPASEGARLRRKRARSLPVPAVAAIAGACAILRVTCHRVRLQPIYCGCYVYLMCDSRAHESSKAVGGHHPAHYSQEQQQHITTHCHLHALGRLPRRNLVGARRRVLHSAIEQTCGQRRRHARFVVLWARMRGRGDSSNTGCM